jgi:hypothetical protein
MQRRLAIAALGAAVVVAPLQAQLHTTPRAAAPMAHGGLGARGPVGFPSHPSFVGTPRLGFGFGTGVRLGTGFGFSTGLRRPIFFRPRRFNQRFFFASSPWFFPYYGYPAPYGGYAYAVADSYPGYYDYAASYETERAYRVESDLARQQEDIDRLEDEVARLRAERQGREAAPLRPRAEAKSEPAMPTLLVFRDQRTQEVRNYAIVGQTLWIFSEQRATKLPLSSLDLDATTQANQERGLDFQIPR